MFGLFKKKQNKTNKNKELFLYDNFCRIVDSCVNIDQLMTMNNFIQYLRDNRIYSSDIKIKMINYLKNRTYQMMNNIREQDKNEFY